MMRERAAVIFADVVVHRRRDGVRGDHVAPLDAPRRRIDVLFDAVAARVDRCDHVRVERLLHVRDGRGDGLARRDAGIGLIEHGLSVVVLVPGLAVLAAARV